MKLLKVMFTHYNQKSAGLATRNLAKTFIYAFLYGSGDRRIASITGKTVKEAKALKEKFLKILLQSQDSGEMFYTQ